MIDRWIRNEWNINVLRRVFWTRISDSIELDIIQSKHPAVGWKYDLTFFIFKIDLSANLTPIYWSNDLISQNSYVFPLKWIQETYVPTKNNAKLYMMDIEHAFGKICTKWITKYGVWNFNTVLFFMLWDWMSLEKSWRDFMES